MEEFRFVVLKEDVGKRIDVFLVGRISNISRSAIKKLIENGDILANNGSIKPNYILKKDDVINVILSKNDEIEILPEEIDLKILYEDDVLAIIEKPKGMVTHPAKGHYSGTVVNAILYRYKNKLSDIGGIMRPGIVHRLDKDTSGLIVIAKTNESHRNLEKQFLQHSTLRTYYAIVLNDIKQDYGTIDKPIGRNPIDRKKRCIIEDGRNAVTHFKIIKKFGKYTFVEVRLETGRTHQIRVHMASIGHPLLGDTLYGPEKQKFKSQGQILHAGILGFIHPITNEYVEYNSPLPEYFKKILDGLRNQYFS